MNDRKSELEQVLRLVVRLGERPATAAEIDAEFRFSRATTMRRIAEARHLGIRVANLPSEKGRPEYVVANWHQVEPRVRKWLKLEEQQRRLLADA